MVHLYMHILEIFYGISIVEPSAPVDIMTNVTGSRTATVSWKEGVPPNPLNPAILEFEVYLNNLVVNVMNTTVVLNSLTPFSDYNVTIAARNQIGISSMSNPVSFVTKEEGM